MALELRRRGAPLSDVQQKKVKRVYLAALAIVGACALIILVLYAMNVL